MSKYRTYLQHGALSLLLILICGATTIQAQEIKRSEPNWWFGAVGAGNFNFHRGTSQVLTPTLTTPAPFHKGYNVGPYGGLLIEYRPNSVLGAMLNVGYDDRRGVYDTVMSGCDCPGDLTTTLSYLSVSPSLRIAPFGSGLYLFAGPRIGINLSKAFTFKQDGKPGFKVEDDFSEMRSTVISGEVGIGLDMMLNSPNAATQVAFSPFVSIQPYFGQDPRSVETWNVTTLRVGAALKFGRGRVIPPPPPVIVAPVIEREVTFTVRAPQLVPVAPRITETFPLRNYVFFDAGSRQLPERYTKLTTAQAADFSEAQLESVQSTDMGGRSARQMDVYYNIVNILGDRMRRNPGSSVTLIGASGKGATDGMELAGTVKAYLVNVFGIDAGSIKTEGRVEPRISSDPPGLTKDKALRLAENRRVDIESTSSVLLMQVGGPPDVLRPVQILAAQEDPLAGQAIFTVTDAPELLTSWTLELTDEQSNVQRFGPFTGERETIPAKTILGSRTENDYKVVMVGQTKSGRTTRKESSMRLAVPDAPEPEILRFSVLFAFDESKITATYENFLTTVVAPHILDGGTVIIHGHTDIIGDESYNHTLAHDRAVSAQRILESALAKAGVRGVTFDTSGFGEDINAAPFANTLPEKRFYNRTVIIDVGPGK